MSINTTPSGERPHIGFFGLRNAGKSSVVNAVTGQALSLVSEVKGTTTDPVQKAMELLPAGPVVIIDTPGMDDEGALGEQRVQRALRTLDKTDVAVLVVDAAVGLREADRDLLRLFEEKQVPSLTVYNKADLVEPVPAAGEGELYVSAQTGAGIWELKERIARLAKKSGPQRQLVADLLSPGDLVVLVVPIDSAAPKGRLILPQQQTIRDVLEAHAAAVVTGVEELPETLRSLGKKPRLVITDSQAFGPVNKLVPGDIPLTSFSILMARYKGDLLQTVAGAAAVDTLEDGDGVLIAEGCTHHRQCDDIGTVKMPRWLKAYTGKELQFSFTSGREYPEDLSGFRQVIHCGGCMLNERELRYRMKSAEDAGVPFTNYGTAIACMNGILKRSLQLFPNLAALVPSGK